MPLKKMRIVILTTPTPHHIYFINRMLSEFDIGAVFYEKESVAFPYDVSSPFAFKEERFEKENFFKDTPDMLPQDIASYSVPTINSREFTDRIVDLKPDIGLVFGCGRIRAHVLSFFKKGLINVHRGITAEYRGLDSDLWAVYHNDFENIGVTLHYVEKGLDTGDILVIRTAEFVPEDKIYHLRYKTTVMATDMMVEVLSLLSRGGDVKTIGGEAGRYYSAMPAVLKPICERNFRRFIRQRFLEGNKNNGD